jgi:two-component system KDP operon response regulator KdpE
MPTVQDGALAVDVTNRIARIGHRTVRLTPIEARILGLLSAYRDRPVSCQVLVERVWGLPADETAVHYLRIYIGRLRRKLADGSSGPVQIRTEPGRGYRLEIRESS